MPLIGNPSNRRVVNCCRLIDHIAYAPYLVTAHDEESIADCKPVPDNPDYDPWYAQSNTSEPLSDDMSRLLRQELEYLFYEHAAWHRRSDKAEFQSRWNRDPDGKDSDVWLDVWQMLIVDKLQVDKTYFDDNYWHLKHYFNKSTATYVAIRGRLPDYYDDRLGRYIFRQWCRMHGGRPPLQRYHNFTDPVCFGQDGPRTVSEIIMLHRSICDNASARLDDLVDMKGGHYRGFWPERGKVRSWRDHGFTLGHLFRAVLIVVDEQVRREVAKETEPARGPKFSKNFETFLTWELPQYNVLLVKTGDDTHLSSPVCFESLVESGMTLAVNRPDVGGDMEGEDVVRVKIDVAMKFILDLMRREEKALASVGEAAKLLREGHEEACKRWVERVMKHAQEFGIDSNKFTWEGIRRVEARLNGEAFDLCQVAPSHERLRTWLDWLG